MVRRSDWAERMAIFFFVFFLFFGFFFGLRFSGFFARLVKGSCLLEEKPDVSTVFDTAKALGYAELGLGLAREIRYC